MAPGQKRGRGAATTTSTPAAAAVATATEEDVNEPVPAGKEASNNKRRKAAPSSKEANGRAASATTASNGRPVIVFAHGAGANSKHEWMVRWKELLAKTTDAVEVITFDYPYLQGGKKRAAPLAEKLVDPHLAQVAKAVKKYPGHPLVLVGKSMGSRVGCMLAGKEDTEVAAVVCLGYPLKGVNGKIRDETLLKLRTPVLFVQGTRDPMCPLDRLEQVRRNLSVMNELYAVDGGDHSLKVTAATLKKNAMTLTEVEQQAANAVKNFLKKVLPPDASE